ncbi:uncharacterized protein C2orf78-like [Podarcis raffonei]|uniref:uncharacterized protein C2orf78-like n=1 Tax=Podarcis raffonei TaxID=65483 RepID=UPI00232989AB|nr:uncharacterized protein C2orf78-like [Podarcis raffonei]
MAVVATQTHEGDQSHNPQLAAEGSHLGGLFHLPDDLFSDYPEINNLVASFEPLFPECLSTPLGSNEASEGTFREDPGSDQVLATATVRQEARPKCDTASKNQQQTEGRIKDDSKVPSVTGAKGMCGGTLAGQPSSHFPRISAEPELRKEGFGKSRNTDPKSVVSKAPDSTFSNIKGKRKAILTEDKLVGNFPRTSLELEACSSSKRLQEGLSAKCSRGSHSSQKSQEEKSKEERKMPCQDFLRKRKAKTIGLQQEALRMGEDMLNSSKSKTANNDSKPGGNLGETKSREKAQAKGNLAGVKGEKNEVPSKAVPRTNLALQMIESVRVFHPLGKKKHIISMPAKKSVQVFHPLGKKKHIISMPAKNISPLNSANSSFAKTEATLERPMLKIPHKLRLAPLAPLRLVSTALPKPLPKLAATPLPESPTAPSPLSKSSPAPVPLTRQQADLSPAKPPTSVWNRLGTSTSSEGAPSSPGVCQAREWVVQSSVPAEGPDLPIQLATPAENPWWLCNVYPLAMKLVKPALPGQSVSPPQEDPKLITQRRTPGSPEESLPVMEEKQCAEEVRERKAEGNCSLREGLLVMGKEEEDDLLDICKIIVPGFNMCYPESS